MYLPTKQTNGKSKMNEQLPPSLQTDLDSSQDWEKFNKFVSQNHAMIERSSTEMQALKQRIDNDISIMNGLLGIV